MINLVSSSRYTFDKKSIRKKTQDFLIQNGIPDTHILNIAFVGKTKMKSISNTYKNEDVALPVLSFSYKNEKTEEEGFLGEVIICYPQAVLLAAERAKKVDDMIFSLVKHGVENILKF